jgi:hypothetical protein
MPFSAATAEQVVAVVEAVVFNRKPADVALVARFVDITEPQATAALRLAEDLGFLSRSGANYKEASPLCRFLATPNQMQKASILRIVLESYEPFTIFRERLAATGNAAMAAQQTRVALTLPQGRDEVKDTLIDLGTYSHALMPEGGGRYRHEGAPATNGLQELLRACNDAASAEQRIRAQVGPNAAALVSYQDVIVPLTDALLRSSNGDARGGVVAAGNAVESYLSGLGARVGVPLVGANGINAKLDELRKGNQMPQKLLNMGKYLGHIRNAADHGIDADVGAAWEIRQATGVEYVFVACSFIAARVARERGEPVQI